MQGCVENIRGLRGNTAPKNPPLLYDNSEGIGRNLTHNDAQPVDISILVQTLCQVKVF